MCGAVDFVPLLITFAHEYSFAVVNFDDPQNSTHACPKPALINNLNETNKQRPPQQQPSNAHIKEAQRQRSLNRICFIQAQIQP